MTNPLLAAGPLNGLLDFDALKPEHVAPALDQVLSDNRAALKKIVAADEAPTWEGLIEAIDQLDERLSRVWGPVSHLFGVHATPEWREAYNAALPKVTEYSLEVSQSEALFARYEALSKAAGFADLDAVKRKVIEDALRDFRLSGIGLPAADKARYREMAMRLSDLSAKFEEHVLDAIKAWSMLIDDESRLSGMSQSAKQQAARRAQAQGKPGWLLTLDYPSFDAVISFADDRSLRETLYTAYATRASDQGPQAGQFDNGPLIEEILKLRNEQAQLLGFNNHAERSLATKMADSPDSVESFLLDLAARAKPAGQQDVAALTQFAQSLGGPEQLASWDLAYYSEKLKEQQLGLNEEALRPYFSLPQVLRGLFDLAATLYGVRITPRAGDAVWHPQVEVFELRRADGEIQGLFYLDPYARDQKRAGAWMDEYRGRRVTQAGEQFPVAYLVCNFRPPLDDQPGLLTHDDVLTLYHEFGHGLHLLMTQVREPAVSGINGVEWDAVELPSQFMENWCFEPDLLRTWARHWQSGEPLPDEQIDRLRASRRFQAGLGTLRQIEFALFDLRLHRDYDAAKGARVLQTMDAVRDEVALVRPPAINRMPWSFSHIFAGGYAAGYYSYKWAEVLSADAFSAFVEAGLEPEALQQTGRKFLDAILSRGGSGNAAELFRQFRGRDPEIQALLVQDGLVEAAA